MAKERVLLVPHPDKVLIKITKDEWNDLFSIWITRHDGQRVQLFTDTEETAGYERRFRQNLSVGNIIAAGRNVSGVLKGDIAIIDYLVTGNDESLVGFHNGNKLIVIPAFTTYHDKDAAPLIDGKKTYKKGDYNVLSPLIGVVRMGKIIPFQPYLFLKYEDPNRMVVSKSGLKIEKTDDICQREVIGASSKSIYKDGDKILINEANLFSRFIDKKEISVIFEEDVLMKL
jgi:hypothetical protein